MLVSLSATASWIDGFIGSDLSDCQGVFKNCLSNITGGRFKTYDSNIFQLCQPILKWIDDHQRTLGCLRNLRPCPWPWQLSHVNASDASPGRGRASAQGVHTAVNVQPKIGCVLSIAPPEPETYPELLGVKIPLASNLIVGFVLMTSHIQLQ